MNAVSQAWKDKILDHYKRPRAFGEPSEVWFSVEEHNRTCGDHVRVFLSPAETEGKGRLSFTGAGCSLCIASASLMCELLAAATVAEASQSLEQFKRVWAAGAKEDDPPIWQVVSGLRQYPVRSRCVHLPWQALDKLIAAWPEGGR